MFTIFSQINRIAQLILCFILLPVSSAYVNAQVQSGTADATTDQLVNETSTDKPVPLDLQWRRAIDRDDRDKLWQLLATVDISVTNDKGKNALMAAAKLGDRPLLDALLEQGLKLEYKSMTGGTVLMYAVLGNQLEMIEYILSREPSLDAQSTNGWTAAMIAAAKGFDQALTLLVDAGADADLVDVYLWSPLMRAIDNRHSAVVEYLLRLPSTALDQINENGSTALHVAAQMADIVAVELLLASGASVTVLDKNGASAKDIAEQNGHAEIAALIEQQ